MTEAMVATSSSGTLAPRRRFMLLRRLATHRSFQIGFAVVLLLASLPSSPSPCQWW